MRLSCLDSPTLKPLFEGLIWFSRRSAFGSRPFEDVGTQGFLLPEPLGVRDFFGVLSSCGFLGFSNTGGRGSEFEGSELMMFELCAVEAYDFR